MARAIRFDLIADASRFTRGFRDAEKATGKFERTTSRLSRMAVGLLGGGVAIAGIKSFVDAARDANRIAAQTDAVIKSTGGTAGLSARGFADLAKQISKTAAVDDDLIQGGENILATFTKIRAGGPEQVFERASMAATDMAAAMGHGEITAEGLQSANLRLGKALQDPLKGISALTRVGVTFSAQQKDQIRGFVESGDLAKAQGIILQEVAKEFGGSAASSATASKKLGVAWGNAQEVLGNLLIPALDRGSVILTSVIGVVDRNRKAFAILGTSVAAVAGFVLAMSAATKVSLAIQTAVRGATIAWTAAQWLLNAALTANPIGLVVVAIGLLVAGIILAYKNSKTFRDIVGKAFDFVKGKVATVVNFIIGAIRGWLNVQLSVVQGILHVMGKLPGPMGAPFRKAEEAVRKAKVTINAQLDKVQARINRLRGKDVSVTVKGMWNPPKGWSTKTLIQMSTPGGRGGFAAGGRINVGSTGTADDVLIRASKGETVVPADDSRRPEFKAWAASRGIPGFAKGGAIDDGIRGMNALTDRVAAGMSKVMARALGRALKLLSGGGSPAIKAFIRSVDPLPYIWGGAGPGGYDCSGLVSAVLGKMTGRGGGHGQRYFTTASIHSGILGIKPGLGGTLQIGVTAGTGHMAGRYGGLGFEAESTRTGIKTGAAASRPEGFARHFHLAKGGRIDEEMLARFAQLTGADIGGDAGRLRIDGKMFDRGGWLMPGATLAVNRTGRPEPVGATGRITRADARMIAKAFAAELRANPPITRIDDVHAGLLRKRGRNGGMVLGLE
jgi:hypothetical protein